LFVITTSSNLFCWVIAEAAAAAAAGNTDDSVPAALRNAAQSQKKIGLKCFHREYSQEDPAYFVDRRRRGII